MRTFSRIKSLLLLCLLLPSLVECAPALDANDVLVMKTNGLPDSVILDQIRLGGGVAATPEQAARLRAAGASEQVIAALTPLAVEPRPVSPAPAPAASAAPAAAIPVQRRAITTVGVMPGLYEKEGWLTVSNSDGTSYFLDINQGSKRLFLSRNPNGGVEIPPGYELTFNLRKETYKLYGDSGKDLKVRVREGEATRLSLEPFGFVGNSGLTGTAQDRDRTRREVLFNNYTPPPAVIVRESSPVIVVPAPPPHRPRRQSYFFELW